MKKIIALALALIMLLAMVACSGGSAASNAALICGVCYGKNPFNATVCSVCGASLKVIEDSTIADEIPTEAKTEEEETEAATKEDEGKIICPYCGQHTSEGFFCMMCGHSLTADDTENETESEDISGKVICPHCGEYTADGFYCEKCGEGLVHPEISETEEITDETETEPLEIVAECNLCGGNIVKGNKRCLDCGKMSILINGNPDRSDVSEAPFTNSTALINIKYDDSIGFTVQRSEVTSGSLMVDNPNFIFSNECPVILVLMRNYCACGRAKCDISYEKCVLNLFTAKSTNTTININYGYSERVVGEDRYISFISTDIATKKIEGRLRGCSLDFNAVGEYLFDLCFVGFFETKEDAEKYLDDYLRGGSEDFEEKHPNSICSFCNTAKRDTQKSCGNCGRKSLFVTADTEKSDLLVAPIFADAKDISINNDKTFSIVTGNKVTESGEILIYNPSGLTFGECPVIAVLVANYCDCGVKNCQGNESCELGLKPGAIAYNLTWTVKTKFEPSTTLKNSYTSFIYDLSNYTNSVKSGKINDISLKFSTGNEMQFDICFIAFFETRDAAESFVDRYVEDAWS